MKKRKWLSLLLALTMLFTSIPVGMFAEGEDTVVEEFAAVEETVQEPAPAPEVQQEPAPAPAPVPEVQEAPAPAPAPAEEPAPATQPAEEPAPATEPSEEPAPATEPSEEPTPATEPAEEPAPATEPAEEPAPATEPVEEPAPATEPAEEPAPVEEPEDSEAETPAEDPVPEEVTEQPEEVTPSEEPVPAPAEEEAEEEAEAFTAGLAYLSSGEVFEDKQLKNAAGTVNGQAVVYATDRVTGEGELSGNDVIRIAANIDGQAATLYVKNSRLSYLTEAETEDYLEEKHENGISYRDAKLDPVSFVAAEEPVEEEPEDIPADPEPVADETPAEVLPVSEPTEGETEAVPAATEPVADVNEPTDEEPEEAPEGTDPAVGETTADVVPVNEFTEEEPEEVPEITGPVDEEEAAEEPEAAEPVPETVEDIPEEVEAPEDEELILDITSLLKSDTNGDEEVPENEETEESSEPAVTEADSEEGTEATVTETDDDLSLPALGDGVPSEQAAVIVTPPASTNVEETDTTVDFTVVAQNVATYQWQYSTNGTTWRNSRASGYNTATVTIPVNTVNAANQYRCALTGLDGVTIYTDPVTFTIGTVSLAAVIVTPPASTNVEETDENVQFTVVAENVAAYQWQYSTNGTTWRNSRASGYNTAAVTIPVNTVNAANQYRCALTGLDGVTIYTDPVTFTIGTISLAAVIVTPPASTNVDETDENVQFTVVAENADVYQWQYSTNGTTWRNSRASGYNTATVTIPVNAVNAANQYRCAITGLDGVTIYTDPVTFTIGTVSLAAVIVTPPASTNVDETDENVQFTVVAENADAYQWQYSTNGTTWRNSRASGYNTATVTIPVNAVNAANQYRCAITGLDSVTIYTDPVTFTIGTVSLAAVIVTPPQSTTVEANDENVQFTVVAENVDTYQWQYCSDGTTWKVSRATGNKTATVTIAVNDANAANQYRCAIKGLDGVTIYTSPVTFTIASAPAAAVIVTPPQSTTVAATDETVQFTVVAENVDTYQWQYCSDGTTWKVSRATGNKTATVTIAVNDANAANQYRCAIKGLNGVTIYTDPVTFTINSASTAAVIVTPPQNMIVDVTDESVDFTVVAENVDTYQWQYSTNGTSWNVSRAPGNKTATVSIPVNETNAANQYRCAIKGLDGVTIYTDPVTFSFATQPDPVSILTPPASVTVQETDTTVQFAVLAENVDTYQWQYSTDGTTWRASRATGHDTATVTITVNATNAANQYRCALTGLDGVTVYTDPVTFTIETLRFVENDVTYLILDEDYVKVEDYNGTASSLTIPEVIRGYTVTAIGEGAFEDNTLLTSIDLPDTITVIEARAFKNCSNLSDMH